MKQFLDGKKWGYDSLANIKIGTFEFSKPPDVFQVHNDIFFVSGSLPLTEDAKRLRELLAPGRILDLEYAEKRTRVIVGNKTFSQDVIWGHRYELLLYEYNPLELTRRNISNGEV